MSTDWKALCEELADTLERAQRALRFEGGCSDTTDNKRRALIARARAALAEPVGEPAPPAAGEVRELVEWIHREGVHSGYADQWLRAADLLEQRHPAPVPVAERLPGPGDCDGEGRCWWGERGIGDMYDPEWTYTTYKEAQEFCTFGPYSVWLPATALPLPQGEVQP